MSKITKLLIANRGEIALRVMRTAREMGIQTVAVFSEADRLSPHVTYADEAFLIGPAPSNQSYLVMEKIIEVAKKSGAQAIHPGYGFLSENAAFAEKVEKEGLIFVGPGAEAIRVMGSKLAAKDAVRGYDIPLVPGSEGAITEIPAAKRIATEIGYPVLIKASAGGGGKGMRMVYEEKEFESQMEMAVSEAVSAFGDGSVFVEKFVTNPRHIEIQILADKHGNVVHLFERECSVQRRHQKVVEEAPSSVLTPETREAMGRAAVDVARACNYVGAGTVEFIYDNSGSFYFLEMNTRLQVEHPVTEMITGVDLVKEMIRIAEGEPISFSQEDLKINGHAMEVRVYAENPRENFLPDIGTLKQYRRPLGPGVRVDDGFEEGMEVPIYYDPMISKLITWGINREQAMDRMVRAIDEYTVSGVETTLSFGRYVMLHPAFRSGDFDTHFVEKYFTPESLAQPTKSEEEAAAVLAALLLKQDQKSANTHETQQTKSNWKRNRSF